MNNYGFKWWYQSPQFWEIFLLDWVAKLFARVYCTKPWVISSFLSFEYQVNTGVAWSFLKPYSWTGYYLLTVLIFVVLALLAKYTFDQQKAGYDVTGQTLILAGGYANFIDRLLRYGVTDFIKVSFGKWTFPVFNIADIAITIGASLMIYQLLFEDN